MKLNNPAYIGLTSSICGPMEAKTEHAKNIDIKMEESMFDEDCWELAEEQMIKACLGHFLKNNQTDLIIAGDLINQNTPTTNAVSNFPVPFLGTFSACASFVESLIVGSKLIDNYPSILCGASSHFYTAEKQFRTPIEYGAQRKLTTQVTVTGSGFVELTAQNTDIKISDVFIGNVINSGITDANNMGDAMAPAAEATIRQALDSGCVYDFIITGDLGKQGSTTLNKLIKLENHIDTGAVFFDNTDYDVHQGASGPACITLYFISEVLPKLKSGEYKKILLVGTGCLISQVTAIKKEEMRAIAHAVAIERV